jgi:hypothetical protein
MLDKKLKEALSKRAQHERVVFIDIDMPMITQLEQLTAVADLAKLEFRELEGTLQIGGMPAPPAYVFVSNIPDHRNTGDDSFGLQAFGLGFKIPDFRDGAVHHGMHALLKSRERHTDLLSLKDAAEARHKIPATFDGSNPALTFSNDHLPRLSIGSWYKVPDGNDSEVEAQLSEATVLKKEKIAYCIYRTRDGRNLVGTNQLTDDEIRAYDLHPETFFGVIKNNYTRKAETVIDLFDFLFKTYQHTPKEKLLEFLAGTPDIYELSLQSQRDLAITYCERMALHLQGTQSANSTT